MIMPTRPTITKSSHHQTTTTVLVAFSLSFSTFSIWSTDNDDDAIMEFPYHPTTQQQQQQQQQQQRP
jgi:hypothetical protein